MSTVVAFSGIPVAGGVGIKTAILSDALPSPELTRLVEEGRATRLEPALYGADDAALVVYVDTAWAKTHALDVAGFERFARPPLYCRLLSRREAVGQLGRWSADLLARAAAELRSRARMDVAEELATAALRCATEPEMRDQRAAAYALILAVLHAGHAAAERVDRVLLVGATEFARDELLRRAGLIGQDAADAPARRLAADSSDLAADSGHFEVDEGRVEYVVQETDDGSVSYTLKTFQRSVATKYVVVRLGRAAIAMRVTWHHADSHWASEAIVVPSSKLSFAERHEVQLAAEHPDP